MIEVEHLTKRYGNRTAVEDLSFTVKQGEICGLLGPNGAGKSTTMNILTGYLSATEGRVRIDGTDLFEEPEKAKRKIGYLPEVPPLYPDMTPMEYLNFVTALRKIPRRRREELIESAVERTDIGPVCGRLIRNLSKGYRQRVGLAAALAVDPSVIILDEPTVGLDPKQIIEIRELIRELGRDHTVLLSSHILSEVSAVCGKVLIMSRGKCVAYDTPEHLEQRAQRTGFLCLTAAGTREEVLRALGGLFAEDDIRFVPCQEEGCVCARIACSADADRRAEISLALAKSGVAVTELRAEAASLEEAFLELTQPEEAEEPEEDLALDIPLDADGRVVLRIRGMHSGEDGAELPEDEPEEPDAEQDGSGDEPDEPGGESDEEDV